MDLEGTNSERHAEPDRQTTRQQIIDRAQRRGAGSQQEAETDHPCQIEGLPFLCPPSQP